MKTLNLVVGAVVISIVQGLLLLALGKPSSNSRRLDMVRVYRKSCKLEKNAPQAFVSYTKYRFPGQAISDVAPGLCLGLTICDPPMTSLSSLLRQADNKTLVDDLCVTHNFMTPLFLAYYDDLRHTKNNRKLTGELRRLSRLLNETLIAFNTVSRQMLNGTSCPQPSSSLWSRSTLESKVKEYKRWSKETAPINELRTFAALNELAEFSHKTSRVTQELLRRITGQSHRQC